MSERTTRKFYLQKKLHGAVLGKAGATVQKARTECGVHIVVPSRDDNSCEIAITGTASGMYFCFTLLGSLYMLLIVHSWQSGIEAAVRLIELTGNVKLHTEPIITAKLKVTGSISVALLASFGLVSSRAQPPFSF